MNFLMSKLSHVIFNVNEQTRDTIRRNGWLGILVLSVRHSGNNGNIPSNVEQRLRRNAERVFIHVSLNRA